MTQAFVRWFRCYSIAISRGIIMMLFKLLFWVFIPCCLFGAQLSAPQEVVFLDAESSTNFPFAIEKINNRKLIFSIELAASPSNNVEVAVGLDANSDGSLSLHESALTVGYDCGEWFVRSAEKDAVMCEAVPDSGVIRRVYELRGRYIDPGWNLVKVTRRGFNIANESVFIDIVESGFGLIIK